VLQRLPRLLDCFLKFARVEKAAQDVYTDLFRWDALGAAIAGQATEAPAIFALRYAGKKAFPALVKLNFLRNQGSTLPKALNCRGYQTSNVRSTFKRQALPSSDKVENRPESRGRCSGNLQVNTRSAERRERRARVAKSGSGILALDVGEDIDKRFAAGA
jgi:hypothetical protein